MPASKFNHGVRRIILQAVEKGLNQKDAARLAGIDESTYWRWIKRGEEAKSGEYHDFVQAVERVKSLAKTALLRHIGDVGTEGLYLERKYEILAVVSMCAVLRAELAERGAVARFFYGK